MFVEKAPTGLGSAAASQRLGTLCDTAGETREIGFRVLGGVASASLIPLRLQGLL